MTGWLWWVVGALGAVLALSVVALFAHAEKSRRDELRRASFADRASELALEMSVGGEVDLAALSRFERRMVIAQLVRYAEQVSGADRSQITSRLVEAGELERQTEQLRSISPWRRLRAVRALGVICAEQSSPELLERLQRDTSYDVREAAALALAHIGAAEATVPLLRALGSHRLPEVVVTRALLEIGGEAVEGLREIARESDSAEARTLAVQLIGYLGSGSDTEIVAAALKDPHPRVREAACWAAARVGDERVEEGVRAALSDEVASTRAAAARAAGELSMRQTWDQLSSLARGPHHLVALAAARALRALDAGKFAQLCERGGSAEMVEVFDRAEAAR